MQHRNINTCCTYFGKGKPTYCEFPEYTIIKVKNIDSTKEPTNC